MRNKKAINLILLALVLMSFSGIRPVFASSVKIEYQIDLLNHNAGGTLTWTTSGTYVDFTTQSDRQAVLIDLSKFVSPTFYFEAILCCQDASTTAYAALFDQGTSDSTGSSATQVSGSEVTALSTTYVRVRSGTITLTSGNRYRVKIHRSGSGSGYAWIRAARIIVVDDITSGWTKGEEQVEIGLNQNINNNATHAKPLNPPVYYLYEAGKRDGTVTIYFEACFVTTSGVAAYCYLWCKTDNTSVVMLTDTAGWPPTRRRSAAISLTDGKEYEVRTRAPTGASCTLSGARLIIQQSGTITKTQLIKDCGSYEYGQTVERNMHQTLYDASKITLTKTIYYETCLRSDNVAYTASSDLYNATNSAAVSGSQKDTTSTSIVRLRSGALGLSTGKEYDSRGWCTSTYFVSKARIIINVAVEAPTTNFAFVDSGSVAIGTGETTITTIDTPFTSGNNFVLAVVQFQSTAGAMISHGNLRLTRGGTALMSNRFDFKLASSAPDSQKWYVLMDLDTSPGLYPSYDVRATANATGVSGEAKILVINGVTGSEADSGGNVTILNTETTLATLSTSLPAGDNIVFAISETVHQGNIPRHLTDESLKRGSILAGAEFQLYHGHKNSTAYMQDNLIPYLDLNVPANPQYTVTTTVSGGSSSKTQGWAKIVAFSRGGWEAYYTDGGSKVIPNPAEDTIAALSTSIPSDSEAVVIASWQVDNADASTNSIFSGELKLQQDDNSGTQTVNEYALQYPMHQSGDANNDDGKCFALLNKFNPTTSSPTYKVKARAGQTPGTIWGEAKILALAKPHPIPEFPLGAMFPLLTGLAILMMWKRRHLY